MTIPEAGAGLSAIPVLDMTLSWSAKFQDEGALRRLKELGVRMVGLTVGSDRTAGPEGVMENMTLISDLLKDEQSFILARTGADLERAIDQNLLALELNFQGIGPLAGNIENIRTFAELGIRHVGICWNAENAAGGSAVDAVDKGLTTFGRQVIRALEASGILVDGAHAGFRTMMEAMDVATKPFIISHTNCFSVTKAKRNVTDEQIKACAATGGVIGMTGFGNDVGDKQASSEALFRHIDHVAQLVGPHHVGLGLDFVTKPEFFWGMVETSPQLWPDMTGRPMTACRFYSHDQLPQLENLMISAGYSEDDRVAILGGNWLRICREAWGS